MEFKLKVPKAVLIGAVAVLLIGGAAVGGYLLGKNQVDEEAAHDQGYAEGRAAGYDAGYGAGQDSGPIRNYKDGKTVGYDLGYTQGGNDAVGTGSGLHWVPGQEYIVDVEPGSQGVTWQIKSSLRMSSSMAYFAVGTRVSSFPRP